MRNEHGMIKAKLEELMMVNVVLFHDFDFDKEAIFDKKSETRTNEKFHVTSPRSDFTAAKHHWPERGYFCGKPCETINF
jgi:hypothetical protein